MANIQSGEPRRSGSWKVAMVAAATGMAASAFAGAVRRRHTADAPSAEVLLAALRERMGLQAMAVRQLDHDLRAPVGAMAVALELLGSADDPVLQEEAIQVLVRQVARMNTLTQRLHEISRDFNG